MSLMGKKQWLDPTGMPGSPPAPIVPGPRPIPVPGVDVLPEIPIPGQEPAPGLTLPKEPRSPSDIEIVQQLTDELKKLCASSCRSDPCCTEDKCNGEAGKIAARYVEKVNEYREFSHPAGRLADIRGGHQCFDWASNIEATINALGLECFSADWVGDYEGTKGDGKLRHNYVNISIGGINGGPNRSCSLILDPWTGEGTPTWYTGEHRDWNWRREPQRDIYEDKDGNQVPVDGGLRWQDGRWIDTDLGERFSDSILVPDPHPPIEWIIPL
jgi:hypothetical protein